MLCLALVLAALPGPSVVSMVVGQQAEIIRGKPSKRVTAKPAQGELAPQTVQDHSQQQAKSDALDRKAAELDAKGRELARKEKALDEQQQAADEKDKAQAEKQKALQKRIEQIGQENQAAFGAAADALSGN